MHYFVLKCLIKAKDNEFHLKKKQKKNKHCTYYFVPRLFFYVCVFVYVCMYVCMYV